MSNCINPECRGGLVPGVRVAGNGTHDGARPGARMVWTTVACPACRPTGKGPAYTPNNRSSEEIEQRWYLAKNRAPYSDKRPAPGRNEPGADDSDRLERIRDATPTPAPRPAPTPNNQTAERVAAALEKLVARVEMLTGAVLELIEKEANPIVTVSTDPPEGLLTKIAGLLQQLVDNASVAPRLAETETCVPQPTDRTTGRVTSARSSRQAKRGASGRKRGGTAAASTE